MEIQLKKGLLDVCVLAKLRNKESYGYAIISDLSPLLDISESTLYPILKRLLARGEITAEKKIHNGRIRKYYYITKQGQQTIDIFLADWPQVEAIIAFIRKEQQEHA